MGQHSEAANDPPTEEGATTATWRLGEAACGAGRAAALRALWVVGPGFTYAPFSRRFPVVEQRWRAALRTSLAREGLPPQVELPLPSDSVVVAGLRSAAAAASGGTGPIGGGWEACEGALLLPDLGLWPLVVAPAGVYCVALLPAVPPWALAEAFTKGCGRGEVLGAPSLGDRALLSQTLLAAMGVAQAVAELLLAEMGPAGGGSARPPGGGGPEIALAKAADFVQRSLPFGTPRDTNPAHTALWHAEEAAVAPTGGVRRGAEAGSPPSPSIVPRRPAWKPVLLSGEKQRVRLDVVDTISGCVGPGYAVLRLAGTVNCQATVDGCPTLTATLDLQRSLDHAGLSLHPCATLLEEGEGVEGVEGDSHANGRCRVRFTPPLERFTLATYATEARPATLPLNVCLRLECPPPNARARGVSFHLDLGLPAETRGLLEECSVVVRFPPEIAVRNCLIAACSMGSTEAAEESGGGAFTISWDLGHRLGQRSPRATLVGTCSAHGSAASGCPLSQLVGGPAGVRGWLRFRVERHNRSGVVATMALGDLPSGQRGGVVTTSSGIASGSGGVEIRPEVTIAGAA